MTGAGDFWSHVDTSGGAQACWPWLLSLTVKRGSYGQVNFEGRIRRAHRVAYELAVGPIPAGLTIDHVRARGCTLKSCCNPSHLEAVTLAENIARTTKASCLRGHPRTPAFGRPKGDGWRCVACETVRQRERRLERCLAAAQVHATLALVAATNFTIPAEAAVA